MHQAGNRFYIIRVVPQPKPPVVAATLLLRSTCEMPEVWNCLLYERMILKTSPQIPYDRRNFFAYHLSRHLHELINAKGISTLSCIYLSVLVPSTVNLCSLYRFGRLYLLYIIAGLPRLCSPRNAVCKSDGKMTKFCYPF